MTVILHDGGFKQIRADIAGLSVRWGGYFPTSLPNNSCIYARNKLLRSC